MAKFEMPFPGLARSLGKLVPQWMVAALARAIHWFDSDVGAAPVALASSLSPASVSSTYPLPVRAVPTQVDALSHLLDQQASSRTVLKSLAYVERSLRLAVTDDPIRTLPIDIVDGAIRQLQGLSDLRTSPDLRHLLLQLRRRKAEDEARRRTGSSARATTRHDRQTAVERELRALSGEQGVDSWRRAFARTQPPAARRPPLFGPVDFESTFALTRPE